MESPRIIELPRIFDPRGNLSFIQSGLSNASIPFEIKRCYWIYDVPGGKIRHGRKLKHTTEFIVALSGSFDVRLVNPDGTQSVIHLCRSYQGLLIPPMHWRELVEFSTNSVALVLASTLYEEADYLESNHEESSYEESSNQ